MRKFFATILAFFYLFSVTGISAHRHHCMDIPGTWSLEPVDSVVCPVCGMEKSEDGCCKDESNFFKNTSDQQIAEIAVQMTWATFTGIPVSCIEATSFNNLVPANRNFNSVLFDRSSPTPVYILNCVFRI